jgi:hypothetical protein
MRSHSSDRDPRSARAALDVDDLVEAIRIGRMLRPWFGTAKVGLELFSAAGPRPSARSRISATACSST